MWMGACLWRRKSRHDAFTFGANCTAFAACYCAIATACESLLAFAAWFCVARCVRADAVFGLGTQNGQSWRSVSLCVGELAGTFWHRPGARWVIRIDGGAHQRVAIRCIVVCPEW